MDAFEILVVILSVVLAVFLVLGIIFMVHMIKVARKLRVISEKAEHVADNVEAASNFIKNSAGPIAVSKFVSNIVEAVSDRTKKKPKKKGKK